MTDEQAPRVDLEARLDALESEVRILRDRQEILDVVAAYCRGIDRVDETILRDVYHPDGMDRHGPFLGNREQFVRWAIEYVRPNTMVHHGITTHNCELQGDRAYTETCVVFFSQRPNSSLMLGGGARYIDELERRDGRWAIVKRCEIMDCTFDAQPSNQMTAPWTEIPSKRDGSDLSYQRPLDLPEPLGENIAHQYPTDA